MAIGGGATEFPAIGSVGSVWFGLTAIDSSWAKYGIEALEIPYLHFVVCVYSETKSRM
jgi:hypothetical protein